jgi:hypothetical protein
MTYGQPGRGVLERVAPPALRRCDTYQSVKVANARPFSIKISCVLRAVQFDLVSMVLKREGLYLDDPSETSRFK